MLLCLREKEPIFLRTYHAGLCGGLHGDFGVGVDAEAGVEDAIGHLIAELVWVAFANRLGGEVDVVVIHCGRVALSHRSSKEEVLLRYDEFI